MTLPFILRFQESCTDTENAQVKSNTQSQTFTRAEQADPDEDHSSYGVMKHQDLGAGTMTKTRMRAEESDNDRALSPFSLIPPETIPLSRTQTITKVRAEGADEDHGGRRFETIPPCSSS